LQDWGKFFFPEQVCISLESYAIQTVGNHFLWGVLVARPPIEIAENNSVQDESLNKPPLFWRTTEWHSDLEHSREPRRQRGSLPIIRHAAQRTGNTTEVIESVIERFGNSPEIAPEQQFSQPDG
jgi:hypothetical protein